MSGPGKTIHLDYVPQPKQEWLHSTSARLILYGGAVGGGKSAGLRWDLIRWCLRVPGIECFLFRRTHPELEKNHIRRIKTEVPETICKWNDGRKAFEFYNGSVIYCGYAEREDDVLRQQGQEIHVLGVDEAGQCTPFQLSYLIGRCRLGGFRDKIPEELRKFLPRVVLTSNPGGPSHSWLKETFITPAPHGQLFWSRAFRDKRDPTDKGRLALYIRARMEDNAYIDEDYASALAGLPEEMQKAYRDGDWDAVIGQALTLSRDRHMLRAFVPPRHWTRFMSIDWGTGEPFSVGWYCVSEGAMLNARDGQPERWLPAGMVIRYAEWYGWNGKPNKGCRMDSRTVARGIRQRETDRNEPAMDYRIADSAMWAQMDGPSPAENMQSEADFSLTPSKKDRERNYDECLARLAGNPEVRVDGRIEDHPMFAATENCVHFWRTVPILTLDEVNPNKGPGDDQENHVYDEWAYALRSRPYVMTQKIRDEISYQERRQRAGLGAGSRYATSTG